MNRSSEWENQMLRKRIITPADDIDAAMAGTTKLATFVCECGDKASVENGVCLGCLHTFIAVWETDSCLCIYTVPPTPVASSLAERYLIKREVLCPYCAIPVVKSDPASELYDAEIPMCENCGSVVVPYGYVSEETWHLNITAQTGYEMSPHFSTSDVPIRDKELLNAKVEGALEVLDYATYLDRITRPRMTEGMTPDEIRTASVQWFISSYIEAMPGSVLSRDKLWEAYYQSVVSADRDLALNKRDKDILFGWVREMYPGSEKRGRLSKNVVSRYFSGLQLSDAWTTDIQSA